MNESRTAIESFEESIWAQLADKGSMPEVSAELGLDGGFVDWKGVRAPLLKLITLEMREDSASEIQWDIAIQEVLCRINQRSYDEVTKRRMHLGLAKFMSAAHDEGASMNAKFWEAALRLEDTGLKQDARKKLAIRTLKRMEIVSGEDASLLFSHWFAHLGIVIGGTFVRTRQYDLLSKAMSLVNDKVLNNPRDRALSGHFADMLGKTWIGELWEWIDKCRIACRKGADPNCGVEAVELFCERKRAVMEMSADAWLRSDVLFWLANLLRRVKGLLSDDLVSRLVDVVLVDGLGGLPNRMWERTQFNGRQIPPSAYLLVSSLCSLLVRNDGTLRYKKVGLREWLALIVSETCDKCSDLRGSDDRMWAFYDLLKEAGSSEDNPLCTYAVVSEIRKDGVVGVMTPSGHAYGSSRKIKCLVDLSIGDALKIQCVWRTTNEQGHDQRPPRCEVIAAERCSQEEIKGFCSVFEGPLEETGDKSNEWHVGAVMIPARVWRQMGRLGMKTGDLVYGISVKRVSREAEGSRYSREAITLSALRGEAAAMYRASLEC